MDNKKQEIDSFRLSETLSETINSEITRPNLSSYILSPRFKSPNTIDLCNSNRYHTLREMRLKKLEKTNTNKISIECSPEPKHNKNIEKNQSTDKKRFKSGNNPHDLVRCVQKEKYVWYGTYDEEMKAEYFKRTLNLCADKSPPIVYLLYNNLGSKGDTNRRI